MFVHLQWFCEAIECKKQSIRWTAKWIVGGKDFRKSGWTFLRRVKRLWRAFPEKSNGHEDDGQFIKERMWDGGFDGARQLASCCHRGEDRKWGVDSRVGLIRRDDRWLIVYGLQHWSTPPRTTVFWCVPLEANQMTSRCLLKHPDVRRCFQEGMDKHFGALEGHKF